MKFSDPLATYYYLGGSFPTHVGMSVMAGFIYFHTKDQIDCEAAGQEVTPGQFRKAFQDVMELFVSHVIYVVFFIVRMQLDTSNQT